ncbi:hypothetical protein [Mesorhizobium sp. M7A.F.Ca.US.010.02.1.1]|uniref:hypothetical protein n=1 Tax=Mesorhizobium sp. M7A.F.Ca.US.010.02.1.1 TaxID=2496743 RepID=UPI000FD50F93|nr:hypothetical protein [Mesorhizobium sp. M7A.F.Ca.US.010.02.1.1]RUW93518.1 hypothetical protein EOA19_05380 [Mesorhizobium sp. M7A.F.Ca.US.010.02.1.1]
MKEQNPIDLFPYLAKYERHLMVDYKVALKLHITKQALIELVQAGLGPKPHPAFASGHYWFSKAFVPSWKSWAAREAGDDDIRQAADIILKDDRTRRIREFEHYDNADPRRFLTTLFSRKAW